MRYGKWYRVANHIINVNPLNPLSAIIAARRYQRILYEFDRKVDIFIAEVAELARETAQNAFGSSVVVTAEPIENGYAIIASGSAIGFLEFGAGDSAAADTFANQVSYEVRPGSWSETHAKEYSDRGFWVFGGVIYTQVPPTHAMQQAWDAVHEQWSDIAERVFA